MKYSSKVLAVCFVAVLVMFYYSKTVFASTVTVDFDTAISGTGGDPADDFDSDTLADGDEFAVLSTLLADDTIDLSSGAATGQVQAGVAQADVYNAWIANQTQMSNDLAPLGNTGAAFVDPFAAFMTLADPATVTALVGVVGGYGITLDPGNYDLTQADFLSAAGDADGDGYTNKEEYDAFIAAKARSTFVNAALDPTVTPSVTPPPPPSSIPTVPSGAPATDALGLGLLTLVLGGSGALLIRRKK